MEIQNIIAVDVTDRGQMIKFPLLAR